MMAAFPGGLAFSVFPSSRRRSGSEPSGTGENPGRLLMILRKIFPDCSGISMLTATGAGAERTSRSSLSAGKASVGSRSTAFPLSGGRLYSNSVTVPGFRNRERRAGGRPPSVWMEISLRRGDGLLFLTAILQWPGPAASTGVIPAKPAFSRGFPTPRADCPAGTLRAVDVIRRVMPVGPATAVAVRRAGARSCVPSRGCQRSRACRAWRADGPR